MATKRLAAALAATLLAGTAHTSGVRADAVPEAAQSCGGCHQLQPPQSGDIEARIDRKGPPLYYAGNKFREDWLVAWLQEPTRIRPAGDFPPAHVTTTADGDVVDATTLIDHPALDASAAEGVAEWLMTLTAKDELIAAEAYTPGNISERMGAMDFVKFKGCGGCHRDTPEYGGLSGPELYTAWQRLQPEFIVSYIRDPRAWEPATLMPVKHLQTPQIHKLVNYLRVIGEKEN